MFKFSKFSTENAEYVSRFPLGIPSLAFKCKHYVQVHTVYSDALLFCYYLYSVLERTKVWVHTSGVPLGCCSYLLKHACENDENIMHRLSCLLPKPSLSLTYTFPPPFGCRFQGEAGERDAALGCSYLCRAGCILDVSFCDEVLLKRMFICFLHY